MAEGVAEGLAEGVGDDCGWSDEDKGHMSAGSGRLANLLSKGEPFPVEYRPTIVVTQAEAVHDRPFEVSF